MASSSRYGDLALSRRLLREAGPYRGHLLGLLLFSLVAAPVALLVPLPLQIVVDGVIGGRPLPSTLAAAVPEGLDRTPESRLLLACGLVVVATLLVQGTDLVAWVWRTWVGERMVLDLRSRLFRHVQRLSLGWHDARGTAESVYRVQQDAGSVSSFTVYGIVPVAAVAVRVAVMLTVAALIDVVIAGVAVLVALGLVVLVLVYRGPLRRRWREAAERQSAAMGVVQEALGALRVVKAFGQEDRERERYLDRARAGVQASVRAARAHGTFDLWIGLAVGSGTAVVLWVGATHVRAGDLTLGEWLLAMGYLSMLFQPLREFGSRLADLQRSLAGAERVFSVLDERPEAEERPDARPVGRARGAVRFEGVRFGYDPSRPILLDVSLDVPAGARVGIAGRSGSGKTTLLSLLPRFYDPDAGRILLDGVDLRDLVLDDLRDQFAIVLQEAVLFSTTIRENIAYGRPGAGPADIEAAARAANAHEFIAALPDGYETQVGERGMKLSGGERQRISIARAFLRDAPVLILDEPTSSVDVRTEEAILEALGRLMEGRTTFMIAHRISTLEGCDLRIEVAGGRIVEHRGDLSAVALD